jgi:hypothetical protein
VATVFHYVSPVGVLWIKPQPGTDRVALGIDEEPLGSYHTPQAAADDVYTQHTGSHAWDSLTNVRLPRDLSEWEPGLPV